MAAPPASMSRSKTSRGDMQSLADSMLRSSIANARSVSSVSSTSTIRPSHDVTRHPETEESSTTSQPFTLGRGLNDLIESLRPGREKPPVDSRPRSFLSKSSSATSSITSDQHHAAEFGGTAEQPRISESPGHSDQKRKLFKQPQGVDSTTSGPSSSSVSAAEAKERVQQLEREVNRTSAAAPRRLTAGLFKAACSTDLLFLIDTTFSMDDYINAAKEQVKSIMMDIKQTFLNEAEFLDQLEAIGGNDAPEDVLGGMQQAINASWDYQSRCIVHIADAPPHGRTLHDLRDEFDDYIRPGSEPHGLLHEPLLGRLVQLKINYCLLQINSFTDRMAFAFARIYAAARADVKLLPSNAYYNEVNGVRTKDGGESCISISSRSGAVAGLQFEELKLGTTYNALQHLVLRTATGSASRTASRLSSSLGRVGTAGGRHRKLASALASIEEDEDAGNVRLERNAPLWDTPGWLDEMLVVEGFCPDIVEHSGSTLNDMMALDENIKLSVVELTIYARSVPFAQGAIRTSSYARTAASTNRFVVKSYKKSGKGIAHLAEDLRCQALCKAFALEFNALMGGMYSIDFIVTACLQGKPGTASAGRCISLEPLLEGEYVKYNNNCGYVNEEGGPFNQTAQAFSHFTFERSRGRFLITDLQGAGLMLTDPSVQTLDEDRFKLNDTNLNKEGFKFFFATHACNSICQQLGLRSSKEKVISGRHNFRERWPPLDSTVCCSNKLCRRIVRLASARKSDDFPGHRWCDTCWPQLESSAVRWICTAPGPFHEYNASKFFYESQGRDPPRRCPEHLEDNNTTASGTAITGSLWTRMKFWNQMTSTSGKKLVRNDRETF
ncbi:hypothetical protein F5Y05DRAFT_412414 [Hypoxylon sp. FL0543]|nr:hypothetical protein F5Y05DRAFT_412414 [Hypoxylon sp. FL0543]